MKRLFCFILLIIVSQAYAADYKQGEVIIKLKTARQDFLSIKSDNADSLAILIDKYGLYDAKPIFVGLHNHAMYDEHSDVPDLIQIYLLKTDKDVLQLVKELENENNIEYAEPNYLVRIDNTPNDPDYRLQWSLNNSGQVPGLSSTPDADIDAEEAWNIHTGGPGAVVAIVDTGVDYNHPDIADNMWINEDEIAGNGVDDDQNGYIDDIYGYDFDSLEQSQRDPDPMDNTGHGTHCAGIAAARGNNSIGITGVSWKSRIMALKFIGSTTGTLSDASEAFYYAVDNGAKVISNSWGIEEYSYVMKDAVEYADANGVVVVASAGNSNRDKAEVPALYEEVIAVAATDANDEKAYFSNFGDWIDVAAPGVDILSLKPGGGTTIKSGTSMACPHVAGLAALLFSYSPELTEDEVRRIVEKSADDLGAAGKDYFFGNGRINAYRALLGSSSYIENPGKYLSGTVAIRGSAFSPLGFVRYELYYSDGLNNTAICSSEDSVEEGVLCMWNTSSAPEGRLSLVLKVVFEDEEVNDSVDVIVDNRNDPPYFRFLHNHGTIRDKRVVFKIEAADIDDPEQPRGRLSYSALNLPAGAVFENLTFSWNASGAWRNLTFTVEDSQHLVSKSICIDIVEIASKLIANDSSFRNYPSVLENKVIWNDRRTGQDIIYMYDLDSMEETEIAEGRSASIHGDLIAFSRYVDADENIFLHNLSSGATIQLNEDLGYQINPEISDSTIIWQDNRNDSSDIYSYDLASQTISRITDDRISQGHTALDGKKIVWVEYYKLGIFNVGDGVYIYDLESGEKSQISRASYSFRALIDLIAPSIDGETVAWNEKIGGSNNIYALYGGKEIQLTADYGEEYNPSVYGDRIAFIRDYDIYLFDMANNKEIRVTHDGQFKHYVDLYDDKIVWSSLEGINIAEISEYVGISTCEELQQMNSDLTADYQLTEDIDCSETSNWNNGQGFEPVGGYDIPQEDAAGFSGTLDGQGFRISGLYINRPSENYVGLFGSVADSGTVKNVLLDNAGVTGKGSVGAIAGYSRGEIIRCNVNNAMVSGSLRVGGVLGDSARDVDGEGYVANCSCSHARVTGISEVGGLVGYNGGEILSGHSSGHVNGTTAIGGLAGHNPCGGLVRNSSSSCIVHGEQHVGGLLGADTGDLHGSFATGDVFGILNVGGLCGKKQEWALNSYATGDVAGETNVGGLIGYGEVFSLPTNSYATVDASGTSNVGGLVGYNSDQFNKIENCFAAGKVSGSDNVGAIAGNNNGMEIVNSYYLNNTINGCSGDGSGICNPADNESYFYIVDNAPMASWDQVWAFNGRSFPVLGWQDLKLVSLSQWLEGKLGVDMLFGALYDNS